MSAWRRTVLALGLLAACHAADAFGPKTHLWIGEQILTELRNECRIKIASNDYQVRPELCQAIRSNAPSFYAGALGPDVYPDLVAGQNTTHSGVKDGWSTAEFLEHVVSSATTPSSRAFAAGYLVHAASDVFGHSYVNAYAGDIWNMGDETAVELRHTLIEKYIDAHLPPIAADTTSFQAPADFVRDALVHNRETQAQYRHASHARHLVSMTNVKGTIDDLAARAETLSSNVSGVLAKSVEFAVTLAGQLADGEVLLAVASAALEAPRRHAAAQRVIVADESTAVAAADSAINQHESKLKELSAEVQEKQRLAAAANGAAEWAKTAAGEVRTQLSELEQRIRSIPPKIAVTVCHNVTDKLCDTLCRNESSNPICRACDVPRQICTAAERSNEKYEALNKQIAEARQRAVELESEAAAEKARAEAATRDADTLLEQQAAEAAAGPRIFEEKRAAEAAYRSANEQYASILATLAKMQHRVDELRSKAEETRKSLLDTRAINDQLRNVVTQLNVLSHFFHNWQRGINRAGSALVLASDRVGQAMLGGRVHLYSEYRRWLACDGGVYLAAPYQVADIACHAEVAVQQLEVLLREIARAMPGSLKQIYGQFEDLKSRIDTELKSALTVATKELVRFVSDKTMADFFDLLVNPKHATRAKLNEALATTEGAKGKQLLVFDNGADVIDRDIGLKNGTLDPGEFAALSSAVTLAKLSLLDQPEMRKLVLELGGAEAEAAYDVGKYEVGRSILTITVRSLDGNEQWQPYGLPYPRSSGEAAQAIGSDGHYGFGPGDERRHGFPLFVDAVLRKRVFPKLFPKQIHGEVAKRPEMAPGRYPFPICDSNPFPVTFLPTGDPSPGDGSCSTQAFLKESTLTR